MDTQFFVAEPSDIKDADVLMGPARFSPTPLPVDTAKVSTLDELVTGVAPGDVDSVVEVSGHPHTDRWVFQLRPPLVARLAHIEEVDVPHIGERWALTTEWVADRTANTEINDALLILIQLARDAERAAHSLLMWVRL